MNTRKPLAAVLATALGLALGTFSLIQESIAAPTTTPVCEAMGDAKTEKDENNALNYLKQGNTHYELKEYELAIADYSQAIQLQPDFAFAYNNRGFVYDELQKYDKAIADYSQAIELQPDFFIAYYNRAKTYILLTEYKKAIADLNQVIELQPDFAEPYLLRAATHLVLREKEKATNDLEKASLLFQQQGNTQGYQAVQEVLQQVQSLN